MRIVVLGGGMVGRYLLEALREEHQVVLVEKRLDRVKELRDRFPDADIVHGDACEPKVLDVAKTAGADAVAAVTGDDEDNLVISYLAKFEYGVPMVFARVNNPKNEWLFTAEWGVDEAICSASIIVQLVREEISLGEMVTLLKLRRENLAVEEVLVEEGSGVVGKSIGELDLPPQVLVATVLRDRHLLIPRGDLVLQRGDKVLFVSEADRAEDIRRILGLG
ncbi:NAD-binding protein [Candidatus Solincola tengchongensis]|uniref:potassium channel family protein n=1 Tax=Candidatus Solincola tengchongensis TaxID=2900693 RepID=UPI00257BD664|nr:NAD-binding protein [Candidatus Solincola tengchongensis]